MLVKLADLHWRKRRDRPPVLVGHVAGFDLLIVGRHHPAPGKPDFTLLIGRVPTTTGARLPRAGVGRCPRPVDRAARAGLSRCRDRAHERR
jgi:hypothetical protein